MKKTPVVLWAICLSAAVLLPPVSSAFGQEDFEWKDGQWIRSVPAQKGSPAGELSLVRTLVQKKEGRAAVEASEAFIKSYPGDAATEEILFLGGQAEMIRGRYFQAYEWFEQKQLAKFPSGRFLERALSRMYDIADAFLKGKKRIVWGFIYLPAQDDGLEILSRVADHAPGSVIAEKSLMRIADYHYGNQDFTEAVGAYDRYLKAFKNAPRAPYAMLQSARACYEAFRGAEYDETTLLESQQRYQVFMQSYPQDAAKHGVARTLVQIRLLLAQHTFSVATFYERVHRVDAAKYYYQVVIQQYPGTMWQTQASAALARLGGHAPILGLTAATLPATAVWPEPPPTVKSTPGGGRKKK